MTPNYRVETFSSLAVDEVLRFTPSEAKSALDEAFQKDSFVSKLDPETQKIALSLFHFISQKDPLSDPEFFEGCTQGEGITWKEILRPIESKRLLDVALTCISNQYPYLALTALLQDDAELFQTIYENKLIRNLNEPLEAPCEKFRARPLALASRYKRNQTFRFLVNNEKVDLSALIHPYSGPSLRDPSFPAERKPDLLLMLIEKGRYDPLGVTGEENYYPQLAEALLSQGDVDLDEEREIQTPLEKLQLSLRNFAAIKQIEYQDDGTSGSLDLRFCNKQLSKGVAAIIDIFNQHPKK